MTARHKKTSHQTVPLFLRLVFVRYPVFPMSDILNLTSSKCNFTNVKTFLKTAENTWSKIVGKSTFLLTISPVLHCIHCQTGTLDAASQQASTRGLKNRK